MKTKSMIFCVVVMMSISGGLVWAQDNVPLPPGYGGGGMRGNVPLPPGYGGQTGLGGEMIPGMMGMESQEFPEDVGARCLLKISCDPSLLYLDYRMMKHLWFSTGVLNKAYRQVFNDSNSLDCLGYILFINDAGAPAEMTYSVAVPQMGGKDREVLAAAVENLKSALSKMAGPERDRLREQLSQTELRCDEMEKQVTEMQVEIRNITQEGVTNQKEIQDKISGLKNSLADTQMRLLYSDIRVNELRKQKDELQIAIEKSLVADTVTQELKNIVKGAEESLAMVEKLYSAGETQALNVQEAKEKLTRVKIELARRMEEVRRNAGQDQVADIDGKIAAVNSQVSELRLGLQFKEGEYSSMKEQLATSDALELRTMKLDAAKKSYYEMLNLRENLKNRLLMQQPLSVSIIGME